MKTTSLVLVVSVVCSAFASAAESDLASRQLQVYPKNLARQHLGSNLFLFNSATRTYAPTEAAAAWLDDDITTGWAIMAGKQHYLLALSEPEVLSNFSISTRPATGTITLYAGDEPATPGAKSWTVIARDLPLELVNNKKLARPFSRFAKYLLIETDIAEPGPMFGLYVFGEKPAVSYSLLKRVQPIDARAIFGQYVNEQTNFNLSGLYSGGRVSYANSPDTYLAWQRAIDDNPESGVAIAATTNESGAVISYGQPRTISRISVFTDPGAKGKLDFYAMPAAALANRSAVSLEGETPTMSIVFDGTNPRASVEFPSVEAGQLALRWTPISAADSLTLREVSTFDGLTLNDYEVSLSPAAVAEYREGSSDGSKEGKDFVDPKKNPTPPEVALAPNASPYLPGSLGFPPTPTRRTVRIPPVSP
ncbi:MAG: hypothetical protein QOE70_4572 [Chthoniobacter sp.]|jgi:hypothetical protein|nr:hypothetical protein [Chthoniobacter sp.]